MLAITEVLQHYLQQVIAPALVACGPGNHRNWRPGDAKEQQ
jgi:hypothetical protein